MQSQQTSVSIGVDVGGTNLRAGLIDHNGEVLHFEKCKTPTDSVESFFYELVRLIEVLKTHSDKKIRGIGIGWPGPVNSEKGYIFETPNISIFKEFFFQKELEIRTQLPVKIENDAKCAGLAEKIFGQGKNFNHFILLTFGTGIGGAVFNEGKLLRGSKGLAGEIGHMTLYPYGEKCSCGNKGCFERYCSSIALERLVFAKTQLNLSSKEILEQVTSHQQIAEVFREYIQNIALGLGSLVNIFDPEAIIFSGGLFTTGGKIVLDRLDQLIHQQGFNSLKKKLTLLPTKLEGKAGLIGASCLL